MYFMTSIQATRILWWRCFHTLQSVGVCSRPQNCGAADLKRRPTSVLPPCFSPRYTTRQSCSPRLTTFRRISFSPNLTDADKVMRQPWALSTTARVGSAKGFPSVVLPYTTTGNCAGTRFERRRSNLTPLGSVRRLVIRFSPVRKWSQPKSVALGKTGEGRRPRFRWRIPSPTCQTKLELPSYIASDHLPIKNHAPRLHLLC
jgi:hypothetical protein